MKRIFTFFLLLTIAISISTTVYAASSKTYILDDLGMSIDIPSEYVVFTRNISDNDPNLSIYGLNKDDMSELMESGNIFLNAWDDAVNFEIIVTMIDSSISDFNLMSDTMLNTLASSFKTEYANSGVTVEKYEIYQHDQAKFIKIYTNQPNGTDKAYGLQYYTVYDNKAINVTMHSYSGTINSEKESILKSIVSTVHFDKAPMLPETVTETNAFVYKDKETGCKFTVPANWSQKSLSQDREFLDVKFTSNKEPGLSILYGSSDIWAEMSSSERKGLSRSDINSSMFSSEELAEIMDVDQSKVSTVSYGGKEYYKYVLTSTSPTYGINIDVTMTCLMRIENGYAYTFQFSGDSKNAYHKDFESLVGSVKYPAVENASSPDIFGEFSMINILISLLITIAIYSVPIIIYRYGIVKKPVEKARAKKITIIYGIIAFIVMSALVFVINGSGAAGGAILLWSWVNYKVLTGGKKTLGDNDVSVTPQTVPFVSSSTPNTVEPERVIEMAGSSKATEINRALSENNLSAPVLLSSNQPPKDDSIEGSADQALVLRKIQYCRRCGFKLVDGSEFCSNCGTQIEKESDI